MYLTSLTEKNNETIIESLNENHYPNNTSSEVLWGLSFIEKLLNEIPETDLKKYTKLNWSITIPGWPHRTANEDFELIERTNNFFEQNGVYAEHPNAPATVSNLGPTRIARYWFPKVETRKSDLLVWYNLVWWLYDDTVETASDAEQKKAIDSTTGDLVDPANEPRSILRAFNEIGCAFSSMPIEWKKKLHLSQSDWFASHGQELEKVKKYNETGIHPGCEEFLTWRYVNIAAFALAVLTDFAMPSQIDEVRWGGYIDKIRTQFNWMCILQNDMTSMKCGKDGGRLNMVSALRRDFNIDNETSFYIMMQMHEYCVSTMSETCFKFAQDCNYDPLILEWIRINVDLACGLAVFHATALRYGSNN